MQRELAASLLSSHVAAYRTRSYSELAQRLLDSPKKTPMDMDYGSTADGIHYTIETLIVWDDREKGHIRVMADLDASDRGCLFGFLPIFTSDAADGFIIAPDGTFVGE